jgi:error-prone DNA polymerase
MIDGLHDTGYIELHAHSCFSLLDGVSPPEELVRRAADLGMDALALTDHDAVYGAVSFVEAAKAHGVQPILGAEVTLEDGQHLTLLVEDSRGWRNLCTLISIGQQQAPKGRAALPWDALDGHTAGLTALSGCRQGPIAAALLRWDRTAAFRAAKRLRELFGYEHCWIELQHHLRSDDDALLGNLVALARHLQLGYVATNNVHYAKRGGWRLQSILAATKQRSTLDQAALALRPTAEYYLKPLWRLRPLFSAYPDALANTRQIAERCTFQLCYGLQDLPPFPTPSNLTAIAYLTKLCHQALPWRYGTPSERICTQLAYELAVIERAGLANYFLIVWDIVRYARQHRIRCQGRGSAANSLMAYLLAISPIDPLAHDLVFERFLSDERAALPDIDIDFAADRREEVIQYVFERYGHDHAAMVCTIVTFQARSALRDIAAALDLPPDLLAQAEQVLDDDATPAGGTLQLVAELCREIHDLPRHIGQHNGGMVLMGAPLAERVPIEPARMAGRKVVQWDKDALESIGLIKIDILGLRILSAISEALEIIAATTGQQIDLDRLTFDDPQVFDLISRADTIGVFQVESRAQEQILPRLRPSCFADLIVTISLIRPGPLQGDMVHPYIRRRQKRESVTYKHPLLKPALEETLGVILFQEQLLKVAASLAGFSGGQGELLRRALGSKHAEQAIERLRDGFVQGAAARGVPTSVATAVFEQLRAFGGYSFPKSHAAAFAVLVYQSAWLKHYYPAAFYCALLNHQPMGFWPPQIVVNDAKRHRIVVLPLDIGHSPLRCGVERGRLRLGLNYVKGLGQSGAQRIVAARNERRFADLADVWRRTQLPRRIMERLIRAGAFDGWGRERRDLLWELGTIRHNPGELDLAIPSSAVNLSPMTRAEAHAAELAVQGLSTGEHLMAFYRAWLDEEGIESSVTLEECDDGQLITACGVCVMHQAPPTAKGFHFVALEDEWGMINVIVSPGLVVRAGGHIRGGQVLIVEGTVQREGDVVNLIAQRVAPIAVS